jgi:PAS domain S-box-containing protein
MLLVDDGGAVVLVNRETERLFGYPREDLLGKPVEILVPERFRHQHPAHRGTFHAAPSSRAMGAGRELHGLREDGTEFPVEIGLTPVRSSEGLFVLSAVVDITERMQAQERFRLAVESSPSGMIMVNAEGTIELVNAETERLFGYGREELVGKPVEILVPTRFAGQHPHHRASFLAAPKARSMGAGRDLYGLRRDGTTFPVEIGLTPIETPEGRVVLCAVVDITERKRTQAALEVQKRELERSNAELEQFAYAVSHDLREPARMVTGFTELLASEYEARLDDDGRQYLAHANRGARRMAQLIADLLAYARVTRTTRPPEIVDLNRCLALAKSDLTLTLQERDAELRSDVLPHVLADERQVTKIFQNLVANAVKFCSSRPQVSVSAREHDGWVEIRVADNGIGIDPDYRDRVFQVFERLHTDEEYPGTGIGLAICKRIVESAGGDIWVSANEPSGTVFHFTLRVPPKAP